MNYKNTKSGGGIKGLIFLVFILGAVQMSYGQGLMNKVKKKAEQSFTDKVLQKTDQAVSKGVDKAADEAAKSAKGKEKNGQTAPNGQIAQPIDTNAPVAAIVTNKPITYSIKYDFVPGESVFYVNDFKDDVVGELPIGWNSDGSSVIVELNELGGRWLRMAQKSTCLTDNKKSLGENFTIEFDLVMQYDFKGWLPPSIQFGLLASGDEANDANKFLSNPYGDKSFYMEISPLADGANTLLESYDGYTRYVNTPVSKSNLFKQWYGQVIHVAIQGQKERLRIWMNGEKMYDMPKAIVSKSTFNQLFFKMGSSSYKDEQIGVYIGNISMATGLPDTRHKLIEEGKFSTTGILFNSGSAYIKNESAGVLKTIADLLTTHPDLKINIIGHTDADGNVDTNQKLSEQRALAVKEKLEKEYGVASERLNSSGKGQVEPVADNKTREGKAQNRRVEFIKL
ncbi:OmpA family protein [Olivibacter sitiensis]|uniref:OmpA family protein n=1 Tax=Olivibacter sitiensis TaxID=376470 RepID=UPI00146FA37B|nr:OmpA family protein [Olivibacter sitiensis]